MASDWVFGRDRPLFVMVSEGNLKGMGTIKNPTLQGVVIGIAFGLTQDVDIR